VLAHRQGVEAVQADEQITPITRADIDADIEARAIARRRLGHRRGLPVEELGRSRSSGGLDLNPVTSAPRVAHTTALPQVRSARKATTLARFLTRT
jgi:hypothetical protein